MAPTKSNDLKFSIVVRMVIRLVQECSLVHRVSKTHPLAQVFNPGESVLTSTSLPMILPPVRETLWLSLSTRGAQRYDYSSFYDAPMHRKPSVRTPRNTNHHSPSTVEGVVPLSHTLQDGE